MTAKVYIKLYTFQSVQKYERDCILFVRFVQTYFLRLNSNKHALDKSSTNNFFN